MLYNVTQTIDTYVYNTLMTKNNIGMSAATVLEKKQGATTVWETWDALTPDGNASNNKGVLSLYLSQI